MKAVITGATGFIGKELVKELLKEDIDVILLVRKESNIPIEWSKNKRIEMIYSDLDKLSQRMAADGTMQQRADIFYHLAWRGTSGTERADIEGQLQNVENACNAVKVAHCMGCTTFVNAGSIMEYEITGSMSMDNYVPALAGIYSTAKLTADYMSRILANDLGIQYRNAVISNIYGAGEKSARFLNTTVRKMLKNEEILLTSGNQMYDFIYVSDAVKMMWAVGVGDGNNENYYIGNSRQRPLKEYLLEMKSVLHSDSHLVFGAVPFQGILNIYQQLNTEKVEHAMGIKPQISFTEGILKMKRWIIGGENEQ